MATMLDEVQTQPPGRDWLEFQGTAERSGNAYILRPAEESSIEIIYAMEDVRVSGEGPHVRVHIKSESRYMNIHIPTRSDYWSWPVGAPAAQCGGAGTRCLGGLKYCCNDRTPVGSCTGKWRCPKDA